MSCCRRPARPCNSMRKNSLCGEPEARNERMLNKTKIGGQCPLFFYIRGNYEVHFYRIKCNSPGTYWCLVLYAIQAGAAVKAAFGRGQKNSWQRIQDRLFR